MPYTELSAPEGGVKFASKLPLTVNWATRFRETALMAVKSPAIRYFPLTPSLPSMIARTVPFAPVPMPMKEPSTAPAAVNRER